MLLRSLACLSAVVIMSACASAQRVVFCGRQTVVFASLAISQEHPTLKVQWRWDARECEQIPESYRAGFATTDECKPVRDGKLLLVTSSSGGCAAVDYPSGRAIWYARVPNAHSIELLPNNLVVVASSVSTSGNKLLVFDLDKPDKPLCEAPLKSAHGVVWDDHRQRLWALGYDELQSYRLVPATDSLSPSLQLEQRHTLPTHGGHDLIGTNGGHDLLLSTEAGVYRFDCERGEFHAHPEIGERLHVKSLAVHPTTRRLAFIQASDEQWWSNQIELLEPSQTVATDKWDVYKLRWLLDTQSDESAGAKDQ